MEEDTYTTGQAARILKVTDRGVRKMIDRGELEADTDGRGRHRIPQRAVHVMLEERRASRDPAASPVGAGSLAEMPAGSPEALHAAEEARELRERVQDLQRQLGRVEGRLELTERTESTMREDLERERARAASLEARSEEERARADAERERAEELRRELEAERSRGFWRRLFGG